LIAIVEDFQYVSAFGVRQRGHRPVVDDQNVSLRKPAQQPSEAAVGMSQRQFAKQLRGASIVSGVAIAASFVRQRGGQPALAYAGCAGEQNVEMLFHPFRFRGQTAQQRAVQAARCLIVDVFYRGGAFQTRGSQPAGQGAVFFPTPLAVDEHSKALFEAETGDVGLFQLLAESIRHAVQAHDKEFV
jgi:hypothetical protein